MTNPITLQSIIDFQQGPYPKIAEIKERTEKLISLLEAAKPASGNQNPPIKFDPDNIIDATDDIIESILDYHAALNTLADDIIDLPEAADSQNLNFNNLRTQQLFLVIMIRLQNRIRAIYSGPNPENSYQGALIKLVNNLVEILQTPWID